MRTIEQTFTGVLPFSMAGAMLRVITASNPVTVRLYSDAGISEAINVADGYWCKPANGFTKVEFIAGSSTYIKAVLSDGESGLDVVTITNTLNVHVTDASLAVTAAAPLPVTAAAPLPVTVAATLATAEVASGTITDNAAVTVGTSATALLAARAARRCVRIFNNGSDHVYVGSAGVTVANGAIRVAPGQLWEDFVSAAAAIYGISATAGQNVRVQEVG